MRSPDHGKGATPKPAVSGTQRLLHLLGGSLSLLALLWIVWRISGELAPLVASLTWGLGAALALAAGIYALLGTLLAAAWWWLVRIHGDRPAALPAMAVWSRSQLAKYLPTNVFHLVSRQLLGRRLGLRHETLVTGHLLESLSLFLAAGLLAGLALWHDRGADLARGAGGDPVRWLAVLALAILALLAWPLFDRLARRLPFLGPRLDDLPHLGWRSSLRTLGPVLALHALFFVGTGSLLHGIDLGWRGVGLPWTAAVWIFALAWSLGTVTPGAPGGLGVREAALTLGLKELAGVDPAYAAGLALALRVVTVLGDVLLYLAACRVSLPRSAPASQPVASVP